MSSGKESGRTTSIQNAILGRRLFNLSPGIILAVTYFLASITTSERAYNLIIAGALIGFSTCIRLISEKMLKRIVRYMFLTGVVMGVTGISPPFYFTIVYGIMSPMDLAFSIVCVVLTVVTIVKIKNFNIL
ncbi:MAG: hypothetical protein NZ873_00075 [Crenarchaeota archaeon]|nr:hypothetical protein [Thermoproteota archaeon]MDW8033359.1 hypothetical protein [Nitrososphaerota archaeon]